MQHIDFGHILEAGRIVAYLFPPRRELTVLKLLAALNLLNAAVKQERFSKIVTYDYVKGMAACLLYSLLVWPVRGVSVWHDREHSITYFRAKDIQVSFHYIPMFKLLRNELRRHTLEAQKWDGKRLQEVAVELLRRVQPRPFVAPPGRSPKLSILPFVFVLDNVLSLVRSHGHSVLVHSEPYPPTYNLTDIRLPEKFCEDKMLSLRTALTFNMNNENIMMLYRRKDRRPMRIVRYTGNNYDELIFYLLKTNPKIWRRRKMTLEVGRLYCVSPLMRIRTIAPSQQILVTTRNSYLVKDGCFCNLCLSYPIACFLARRYPELRFVKTLNYNRLKVRRVYYTYRKLMDVPLHSLSRRAKVWIPVDRFGVLGSFDINSLPHDLIEDYMKADDFYQEYKVMKVGRLKGIRAYYYHWLLPPLFTDIKIRNYHAKVLGRNHKWAVYSLCAECFVSRFMYDSIRYSFRSGCVYGIRGEKKEILVRFNYNEY